MRIADLIYEMWDVRFGIGHGAEVGGQKSEIRGQRAEDREG